MSATKGKSKRVTGLTYTLDFCAFIMTEKVLKKLLVGGSQVLANCYLKRKKLCKFKNKVFTNANWDSLKGVVDFINEELRDERVIFISATAPKQEKLPN